MSGFAEISENKWRTSSPLRDVAQWLENNCLPKERTGVLSDKIESFYKEEVLTTIPNTLVGVSVGLGEYGVQHVWLSVFLPDEVNIHSELQSSKVLDLIATFTERVAKDLLPNPNVHFEVPEQLAIPLLDGSPDDVLKKFADRLGREYIGVLTPDNVIEC